MNYQTMLHQIEKYLKAKGDTYGVEYINEMYLQMANEEENSYYDHMEELTEEQLEVLKDEYEQEQMREEEETHWYTDQPITTNTRYWMPLKYGQDEYALVERDEEGNLVYLDFHTT